MRGRHGALELAALVAMIGVAIAGCSDGDEPDPDAEPYVDAMVVSLTTQQPGELFWAYSEEEATCIAEHTLDVVGSEFFIDNGITTGELEAAVGIEALGVRLDDEQATEVAEALESCDIDFGRYFSSGAGSQTAIECINEQIDVDAVMAAAAARLRGNEAEAQQLSGSVSSSVAACVTAG